MEKVLLKASIRKEKGKNAVSRLRKKGFLPANLVIPGEPSLPLRVEKNAMKAILKKHGVNAFLDLDIAGSEDKKSRTVILKEVQYEYINHDLIHVEFMEITKSKKLKVRVPVVAKGEPVGVSRKNGTLYQALAQVEIECKPADVPDHILVDVSELDIHQHILVSDIDTGGKFQILTDPKSLVFTVIPPKKVEEVAKEAAVEEEGAGMAEKIAEERIDKKE